MGDQIQYPRQFPDGNIVLERRWVEDQDVQTMSTRPELLEEFCSLFDVHIPKASEVAYYLQCISQSGSRGDMLKLVKQFVEMEETIRSMDSTLAKYKERVAEKLEEVLRETSAFDKWQSFTEDDENLDLPEVGDAALKDLMSEDCDQWFLEISLRCPDYLCFKLFDNEDALNDTWEELCTSIKGVFPVIGKSSSFRRQIFERLDESSEKTVAIRRQLMAQIWSWNEKIPNFALEVVDRNDTTITVHLGSGDVTKEVLANVSKYLNHLVKDIPVLGDKTLQEEIDFEYNVFTLEAIGPSWEYLLKTVYSLTLQHSKKEAKATGLVESYRELKGVPKHEYYRYLKEYVLVKPLEVRDLYFSTDGKLAQWVAPLKEPKFNPANKPRPTGYAKLKSGPKINSFLAADRDSDVDLDLVRDKWRLQHKLGKGSFGVVYQAIDIVTKEKVAAKIEEIRKGKRSKLKAEFEMMRELGGGPGIPTVFWFGVERQYNVMIMELLDLSLKDLFRVVDKRFSLKAVVMIADQMIESLEFIHSKGYIHRDMKPQNIMMGRGEKASTVYLIDFGLSKRWVEDGKHIPYRDDKKGITGTAEYVSIHTHRLREQSRRDDLESLGYVLLKFLRGGVPWGDVRRKAPTKTQRNKQIHIMKQDRDTLCGGFPVEFELFLNYTYGLGFTEDPDYSWMRKLFCYLLAREGGDYDYMYDWVKPLKKEKVKKKQKKPSPLAAVGGVKKGKKAARPGKKKKKGKKVL